MKRYLIVHFHPDNESGKYGGVRLYQTSSITKAKLAERVLNKREEKAVDFTGGYPGEVFVVDLREPNKHISDVEKIDGLYDDFINLSRPEIVSLLIAQEKAA